MADKTYRIRVGAVDWREEFGLSEYPSFFNVKTPSELGYISKKNDSIPLVEKVEPGKSKLEKSL
jgi:hypothetical protein